MNEQRRCLTTSVRASVAALLAGLAVIGCTPDAPPRPAPVVATVPAMSSPPAATSPPRAAEPDRAAEPASDAPAASSSSTCKDSLLPEDMLRGNFASTSISALGEIVASSKTGPDGKGVPPATGYVTFRYEVKVLRWFIGAGPERLVLLQTAEAAFDPRPPGTLLFFSACSSAPDSAYEPDVGYFFPVDPACRATLEELGMTTAKRVRGSTSAKRKPRACTN